MYLNVHSYYSLRYGTLSPERLISMMKQQGIETFALTDINNTTGFLELFRLCLEVGIKPVAGIEFRRKDRLLYTGIAKNNDGFRELNQLLTHCNLNKEELPDDPGELQNVFIIYPSGTKKPSQLRSYEYIGIRPAEAGSLLTSEYRRDESKLVVFQPVTFADNAGYELHKHLRAIDRNILLSQLRPEHLAAPTETLIPPDTLSQYFHRYPQIVANTKRLLSECTFSFDFRQPKNKKTFTGNEEDDVRLLRWIAEDGLIYRYGKDNKTARERVNKELSIITSLGFTAYFLITWDIIRFSISRGFYHVGRGSGANSIVAYCLKITDVDPIELDLYFERFINPKRTSPPDFDIDYSWKDRDTVQDYIFKRYGRDHTALLGAMSTFKGRSIYRELGKVYGLPKEEIDALVHSPNNDINKNHITQKIHLLKEQMTDFPNLRSIHAGGILISELPVTSYTALDLPPKGFPTTQWDMYTGEDIGFEKLDILSQRGIGHIKECVDIIRYNRETEVDIHNIRKFKNDPLVKQRLKDGESIGCFYIESPAMRGLLKKLRCSDYTTLVAASSIIRPGVARSGMMKEYIQRFHNPEGFQYIHPVMKEQLRETYGVMVYQEDVLKICHHFAGLDLSDADMLRRAMSGKNRTGKEFQRIAEKYFTNCRKKGYPDHIAHEVWRQIESFAGYSFSKAHSASYAVESFQSLYLKTYFPLEFMVAVINNFGGFYRTWVYFNEARRCGANIELPCVNSGNYKTCIKGSTIYIGFIHVARLESATGKLIEEEREKNGEYKSLEEFMRRIPLGMEQLIILIRTGAFRFTGMGKAALLWHVHLLLGGKKKATTQSTLFPMQLKKYELPTLEHSPLEDAYDEIELFEFTASFSFFSLLQTRFRGEIMARDLINNTGRVVSMAGHLVTIKYVRTVRKELMHFGTFLDAEGEFFDTVHFPDSLKSSPFRGDGVYIIQGKIVEEFDFPSLEVIQMEKLPVNPDPRG